MVCGMIKSKTMKDVDNYEYLRGFADACGVNWDLADEDDYPEGLNSYDEVFDRMTELTPITEGLGHGVIEDSCDKQ